MPFYFDPPKNRPTVKPFLIFCNWPPPPSLPFTFKIRGVFDCTQNLIDFNPNSLDLAQEFYDSSYLNNSPTNNTGATPGRFWIHHLLMLWLSFFCRSFAHILFSSSDMNSGSLSSPAWNLAGQELAPFDSSSFVSYRPRMLFEWGS